MTYYLRFLSLALIIFWSALGFSFEMKVSVKVAEPNYIELHDLYQATGECKASSSRDFYAKISGTISKVTKNQGQFIKAGDVIIEIDGELAHAMQAKALAVFKSAEFTLKNDKVLFAKKLISEGAFGQSQAAFERARYDLEKATADYHNMVIIAPFDGQVGVIKSRVGDNIATGDYLVSITSGKAHEIIVYLPQKLMPLVKIGGKVEVVASASEFLQAEIISSSPHISQATGTFTVKVATNDLDTMKHGSFAKVKFYLNPHKGLAIPEKAIMRNEKGSFVFVVEKDKAKLVYVTLGTRLGDKAEIVSGLTDSSKVVVEGIASISDGSKVTIIP